MSYDGRRKFDKAVVLINSFLIHYLIWDHLKALLVEPEFPYKTSHLESHDRFYFKVFDPLSLPN